jgi:hypothetical protein
MLLGWIGSGLQLAGYALLATGRLTGRHASLHVLNVLGSAGIMSMAVALRAWPTAALNLVWIAIAVTAMTRNLATHRSGAAQGQRTGS